MPRVGCTVGDKTLQTFQFQLFSCFSSTSLWELYCLFSFVVFIVLGKRWRLTPWLNGTFHRFFLGQMRDFVCFYTKYATQKAYDKALLITSNFLYVNKHETVSREVFLLKFIRNFRLNKLTVSLTRRILKIYSFCSKKEMFALSLSVYSHNNKAKPHYETGIILKEKGLKVFSFTVVQAINKAFYHPLTKVSSH